jgi:hypothetical protein
MLDWLLKNSGSLSSVMCSADVAMMPEAVLLVERYRSVLCFASQKAYVLNSRY